jgi:hypothetical protein
MTRKLAPLALAYVLGFAGNAMADLGPFEITVTGTIDYVSDSLGLLDSSVHVGTNYVMTFNFSFGASPIPGVPGLAAYGLAPPAFSSTVTFGDYTISSNGTDSGSMTIWNNYAFSGRGVTDGFQLETVANTVVSTNPDATPLFNAQNSIDAFDSSGSVFSSTALPSLSVYNASNFQNPNSSNALDFISFLHPNETDFQDGAVVGGSYNSISALFLAPEPSSLAVVFVAVPIGLGFWWLRQKPSFSGRSA